MLAEERSCELDLNPHLFYGRLIYATRGINEKKPGFSHSFDTWKMVIIGHRSLGAQHLLGNRTLFGKHMEYGGEPALQTSKPIYAPDSSSLKPGSGATEGVLD